VLSVHKKEGAHIPDLERYSPPQLLVKVEDVRLEVMNNNQYELDIEEEGIRDIPRSQLKQKMMEPLEIE
jgi:hypothetical protein